MMSVLEKLPLPKKKKAAAAKSKAPASTTLVIPRYEQPVQPSQHPVPARLKEKLAALGGRFRFINVAVCLAQILAVAIALVTMQMAVDWLFNLSFFVRLVLLAGDIALLVWFSRKRLLPVLLHAPDLEASALMVEKKWPRLRGRIIAAVQFAKPHSQAYSAEMVSLLQKDASVMTGSLDFAEIVPAKPLLRRLAILVVMAAIFTGGMVYFFPSSLALLERVFLIPAKIPRKTEVIVLSGGKTVPAGESFLIEAQAKGIIPSHGRVTLTYDSGRIQEVEIEPEKQRADIFSLKVDKIEEPFSYVVYLNDGVSDKYNIGVVPRPGIASIECEQIYPAYTGQKNMVRTVGNLALLAGSKLKIHAVSNVKLSKASLKLTGIDKVLPVTLGPDGKDITTEITIPQANLTGFALDITNEAGVSSGDETQYRIDIIPDRPPTIQITFPERLQELCTLKAKPTIAFAATDDYGIAKIDLCYRLITDQDNGVDAQGNPLPPAAPQRFTLPIGDTKPLNLKSRFVWNLSEVKPPLVEGQTVEYWLEVRDNNDVSGPGITESEHHILKIVSPAEKAAEVLDRFTNGELAPLGETTDRQRDVNGELSNIIAPTNGAPIKPAPPAPQSR